MSTPGGSPPGTVTHLIFVATRRALPRDGEASSRRRPRSISTLSGVRVSAARFLARIRRSSGRSTVVFIQENIFPYYHIRQSVAVCAADSCASSALVEGAAHWSFDGDGALFRLVAEARRIRLASSIPCSRFTLH